MKLSDKRKYVRPLVTKQDMISSDIYTLQKKLKNFVQIHEENLGDIDCGIWIKYISNENKYRSGGVLKVNGAPRYFILNNPFNNFTWSVTLSKNSIFMRDINQDRHKMIEKNNLYKLYLAGFVKILDEPQQELIQNSEPESESGSEN